MKLPHIRNDEELEAAFKEFEQIASAYERHEPGVEEAYVLALRDEIDRYELAAGHDIGPPTSLAGILEVEMFRRRLRQNALAELLDIPATRLSEVLRGKRKLNLDLARRLHQRLGLSAELLLNLAA